MPVDRAKITLSAPIRVNPHIVTDTKKFCRDNRIDIRRVSAVGVFPQDDEKTSAAFDIGSYGGIHIYLTQSSLGRWVLHNIEINAGKILHGHNGRILSEVEFHKALSIVIEVLTPLLADPKDAIHLLPGLTKASRSFWSLIEIPFHLDDPDGKFLHMFRNARHDSIRKAACYIEDESVKIASRRGDIKISIYRKHEELADLCRKFDAPDTLPILRVEFILSGPKLLKYVGSARNTTLVDFSSRLVRFSGPDLVAAHRAIAGEMKGCFQPVTVGQGKASEDKTGRLLAHISFRSNLTLDALIELNCDISECTAKTKRAIRSSALLELARLSPFDASTVFSPEAYLSQPDIRIPKLENMHHERREYTDVNPRVAQVYREPVVKGSTHI